MNRKQMLLLVLAGAGSLAVWALLGRRRDTAKSTTAPMPRSWANLQEQREPVGSLFDFLNEPSQVPQVTTAPPSASPSASPSAASPSGGGSTTTSSPATRQQTRRETLGATP